MSEQLCPQARETGVLSRMDFVWTGGLNKYQHRVWEAFWRAHYVGAIAGWGTGKTMALAFCFLVFLLNCPEDSEMFAVGPTTPAVLRTASQGLSEVLALLQPKPLYDMGIKLRQSEWERHPLVVRNYTGGVDPRLVLADGRTIRYKGAHKERPPWDGMSNQVGCWMNEVRLWHYPHPEQVAVGRVRFSADPDADGDGTTLAEQFIARGLHQKIGADTIPAAGHWCELLFNADKDTGSMYEEVRGSLLENDRVDDEYKRRQMAKYPAGSAAERRFIHGEWAASEGSIYADYLTDDAWVDFTPNPRYLHVGGMDFGAVPAVILAQHVNGSDRTRPASEREMTIWYEIDNHGIPTAKESAERFCRDMRRHGVTGPIVIYYDPAGKQKTDQSNRTSAQQFQDVCNQLLPGQVTLMMSPTHPAIRDTGLSTSHLMECFLHPGTGRRRLTLSKGIRTNVRVVHDEDEKPPKTLAEALLSIQWSKHKDKPEKDGVTDHMHDAVRYFANGYLWGGTGAFTGKMDLNAHEEVRATERGTRVRQHRPRHLDRRDLGRLDW